LSIDLQIVVPDRLAFQDTGRRRLIELLLRDELPVRRRNQPICVWQFAQLSNPIAHASF
jgi:hypothetical protein